RRQEAGGRRQEAGGRRQEAGGRRQEAGGRRQEAGGRRQEAGGKRQELRETDLFLIFFFNAEFYPIPYSLFPNGDKLKGRAFCQLPYMA
ncbi:MAG: hypothetical protein F6K41_32260, partial [Symploca sp. SIO3E6]|nr:hypothetical protein [Caldora sp. SIO3E6]